MDLFQFESKTADCGVPVYVRTFDLPWARDWLVIKILIYAGALLDWIPGIAHLAEHMHVRGFEGYPSADQVGYVRDELFMGTLTGSTDFSGTKFNAKIKLEHIWEALRCLRNYIFKPILDPTAFSEEKEVIIQELWQHLNNTINARIIRKIQRDIYGDHPFGKLFCPAGWPDTVANIELQDVIKFLKLHYHLGNVEMIFAGDVTLDQACKYADYFAQGLPRGERNPRPAVITTSWSPPQSPEWKVSEQEWFELPRPISRTSSLTITRALPKLPNTEIPNILSHILYQMVFDIVRSRFASGYGVTGHIEIQYDHILLVVRAIMRPDMLETIYAEVKAKLANFQATDELVALFDRKTQMILDTNLATDFNVWNTAEHAYRNLLLFDHGIPTLGTMRSKIKAVSFEDVHKLMQEEIIPYAYWFYRTP